MITKVNLTGLVSIVLTGLMVTSATVAADDAQWKRDLLDERAARTDKFVAKPTTFLAGIEHHRHETDSPLYVNVSAAGISYSDEQEPDSEIVMTPDGDLWQWQPLDASVSGSFRGETLQPGQLKTGMVFDLDRFTLQIWKHEAGLEFGVFDSERDELLAYEGLYYFEPNNKYRYDARFERFEEMKTVMMLTSGSGKRPFVRYGAVHFTVDGQPVQLTAYKYTVDAPVLFIPFRDRTSGKTTYGAGRFVNTPDPKGDSMVLDLNNSMNFPCAYAPAFHCPIPPRENWLTMAVEAGELDYPLAR